MPNLASYMSQPLAWGILAACLGLLWWGAWMLGALVGLLLPRRQRNTLAVLFPLPMEEVWAVLSDFRAWPTWRTGMRRMEALPAALGNSVWREVGRRRSMVYETVELVAPQKLVRRSLERDGKLPYGAEWEFDLKPVPGGSQFKVSCARWTPSHWQRFRWRFFPGPRWGARGFAADLAHKLGTRARLV